MKKLKILMVHPHDIYSANEPWTIRITHFAQEFTKKGHEVKIVYFPLPENERGLVLKEKHKEFETIPFSRRKWAVPRNILKMNKLAKWADIIHFQKCFPIAALPALFAGSLQGKPVHYDWDDWEYAIYQWNPPSKIYGWYLDFMEKTIPKLADTVSYASKNIKKLALKQGVKEEKLFEAHVGADLKKFNPKNSGARIRQQYKISGNLALYLGQLHGGQYAEMFIKAASIIAKKDPEAKFMIAGGGHYLPNLKDKAKQLGIENQMIFTGFVKYDDVPQYIAAADVCVACFENNDITKSKSPLKIAEYMASGKPVVASNVGEVPRMLGDAGVLVKPGDEKELAKGMTALLKSRELREELGRKARKKSEEEYNWKKTAENLLKAYGLSTKI